LLIATAHAAFHIAKNIYFRQVIFFVKGPTCRLIIP